MVSELFRLRFFRIGAIATRALPTVIIYYGIDINEGETNPCDRGSKRPPFPEAVILCGVRLSQLIDVCEAYLPKRSVRKVDHAEQKADNKWNCDRVMEARDSLCGALTPLPITHIPSVLIVIDPSNSRDDNRLSTGNDQRPALEPVMAGRTPLRSWFVIILSLLVTQQIAPRACAWGRVGHHVISRLAENQLAPAAKAAIAELLEPGESPADASLWADENRGRLPKTAPWHYVDVPLGRTPLRCPVLGGCFDEGLHGGQD
jgi:hypothetical protein